MQPHETATTTAPLALDAGDGERLLWMGEPTLIKASGEDTGGRYALAECFVNPVTPVPLHVHHREDEAFYVLEGEVTFRIGDEVVEAKPGSFVFGPRGVPHAYEVRNYVLREPTACWSAVKARYCAGDVGGERGGRPPAHRTESPLAPP